MKPAPLHVVATITASDSYGRGADFGTFQPTAALQLLSLPSCSPSSPLSIQTDGDLQLPADSLFWYRNAASPFAHLSACLPVCPFAYVIGYVCLDCLCPPVQAHDQPMIRPMTRSIPGQTRHSQLSRPSQTYLPFRPFFV